MCGGRWRREMLRSFTYIGEVTRAQRRLPRDAANDHETLFPESQDYYSLANSKWVQFIREKAVPMTKQDAEKLNLKLRQLFLKY